MIREEVRSWCGGEVERCPHCAQQHTLDLQVWCVDCDAPVCPFCVVVVRRGGERRLCPRCAAEEGAA